MTAVALSYCFPPGRFAQAPQVARFVAALGDDVVVVAGDDRACDESLLRTLEANVRVERLGWSRVATARRLLRRVSVRSWGARPDVYRPWADVASGRVGALVSDGATLLATFGQPMSDHVVGLAVTRDHHVPWLAHFSDPWMDNPYHSLAGSSRWQADRDRRTAERAAAIVVTSRETADLVGARHPAAATRVHVVAHSFDERLYPPLKASNGPLLVRHLGAFYGPRTPAPLLAAIRLLLSRGEDLGGVCVELIGPPWREPIDLPSGLVSVRPMVTYVESLALMRAADALVVIDAPAASSPFLPSKLVDYVGAERPIIGFTPPGAAAAAISSVGGYVANPMDVEAGAAALRQVLEEASVNRGGPWGDPDGRAAFNIDTQRASIARVLNTIR